MEGDGLLFSHVHLTHPQHLRRRVHLRHLDSVYPPDGTGRHHSPADPAVSQHLGLASGTAVELPEHRPPVTPRRVTDPSRPGPWACPHLRTPWGRDRPPTTHPKDHYDPDPRRVHPQ